ncbi:hypothetical protein ABKV19_006114 [Rosa sericea]
MALQLSLVAVLLLLSAASTTTTIAAPAQALPGCSDKCGDLAVPFPFGMEEGCYLREEFSINCSYTTQPPTAYNRDNYIVTNIFLVDGSQGNDDFSTGCMSTCNNLKSVDQNSCSGLGCCKTDIPSGQQIMALGVSSSNNHSGVWNFNPCSYAFIVEQGQFNFSPASFKELENTKKFPMVLNWAIGNDTDPCDEARKREDFACLANSFCINRPVSSGSGGYLCRCLSGYEGNPYHPDGCQDINECETSIDPCNHGTCSNSPGNYSCLCHKGYRNSRTNAKICLKMETNQPATRLFLITLGTGGGLGLIFLAIAAWWLVQVIKKRKNKKRKEKFFKQNGGLVLKQQLSSGDQANVEKIKLFNSRELEKATDHFSIDRILGQGGQGTVYKGMLMDGQIVAVKKSKIVNGGEVQQFINEIVILSQINHRNVVKLLGCCLETEIPLLVYEFLPHGTLSRYIHDQDEEFPLTWGTRLRVSTEVAGALSYLHSAASIPIYHRDIKSTNILLDAKYRAKIADFGTSRSISIDQTHLTTQVHGTFGYLDPEYFQSSQFTEKSDVYSFGVVLAELLTGQKPVNTIRSRESRSLATHFLLSMEQNRLFDILDAQVMKDGSKEEIIAVANLAQSCLNLNGRKRPTMEEVAAKLGGVRLAVKDADHVQQNLVEEGDVGTDEITTEAYCDVVSISTGPFTDGGTADSSSDVQPLMFY